MEQYQDQPAHVEKIAYQQKLLREDVVHIRADISQVSTVRTQFFKPKMNVNATLISAHCTYIEACSVLNRRWRTLGQSTANWREMWTDCVQPFKTRWTTVLSLRSEPEKEVEKWDPFFLYSSPKLFFSFYLFNACFQTKVSILFEQQSVSEDVKPCQPPFLFNMHLSVR